MIKAVRLTMRGDRRVVERAAICAMPGGAFSGGLYLDPPAISDAIRKLCRDQGLKGDRVAVALGGPNVLLVRLKIERGPAEAVEAQVREAVAKVGPFPLAEACLDFQILDPLPAAKWVEVVVALAPSRKVSRLTELLERAGKTPVTVETTACALANAFEVNYEPVPSDVNLLVHLGAALLTVVVLRGTTPVLARDLELATTPLMPERAQVAERAAQEIASTLETLDRLAEDRPLEPRAPQIQRLLLSGGACRMRGLEQLLRSRFRFPIEELDPFRKIEFQTLDALGRLVRDHVHCMAVAVGLALRGLEDA